jgi:hypothetical protein
MFKTLVTAALLSASIAHAGEVVFQTFDPVKTPAAEAAQAPQDKWGDGHVKMHFAGEFALGALAGSMIESKPLAFAVAMVPGIYREEWKRHHGFDSYSQSRMVADIAGAALGVYTGRCLLREHSVTCGWEF